MGRFPVRCEVGAGTGVNMGGTAEALQLLSRLDTGQGLFFVVRRCLSMLPFNHWFKRWRGRRSISKNLKQFVSSE